MGFTEKEERQGVKLVTGALTELCTGWCLNTEEHLDHVVRWPHEAPPKRWQILRHPEERKAKQGEVGNMHAKG